MPLVFEKSFQAQFLVPMAVSISFGLMAATVLTLLYVPALYLIVRDVAHKIKEGYKKVNAELLYFKRKHHLNEDVPVAGFELGILTSQGTSTDGLSLPDLLKHPTHLALQEA